MVQLFVVIQVFAFTKLNQLTYFGRRLRPDDVIVEVRYEGHQNPLNVIKMCFQAINYSNICDIESDSELPVTSRQFYLGSIDSSFSALRLVKNRYHVTFLMKCNPASFYCNNTSFLRKRCAKQDTIPLGYVPPTWKPYVFPASVATTRCHSWRGGRSPNDQVRTGLQWSPLDVTSRGGRSPGLMSGGRGCPYNVTYSMIYLMLPTPPCERTDACENITFPQLRLRGSK